MAKLKNLDNQVVWITGASSGLGRALARECALQGARVILSARRIDTLEKVRFSLMQPEQHLSVVMDICDPAQVQAAYTDIMNHFGRVDWLINNAGISQRALIVDTSMQTERTIMEVDYFAQVALTKLLLPQMLLQKSGRVVFVSSVAGLLGTQYRASYSAAKAAIHLWANSLRAEVKKQGVDVSVVFPGFVQTNVAKNALNGAGQAQGHEDDATANGLSAEDFAEQVVQALMQGQEYIVVSGLKEKLGVALSRVSPKLLYKMIRLSKVK